MPSTDATTSSDHGASLHSAASAGPSSSSPAGPIASTSYRPRPARKQVTPERLRALLEVAKPQNSSGGIYNIWHENFSGGDRNEVKGMVRAETRCDIARDSGYTKADLATRPTPASTAAATAESEGAYCCLYFARGCCPHGAECTYLHRLPRPTEFNDQGRDIFGRSKFGDYRDDMGGVGSMQRVNRTLYVGRIHEELSTSHGGGANAAPSLSWRDHGKTLRGGKSAYDARRHGLQGGGGGTGPRRQPYVESDTEKVVRRHFGEWGEIERVKVLHGRACAFVTYRHETSAQFAKEAMFQQSLDHNEILNVRWSTEDPNPGAQKRDARQLSVQGQEAIMARARMETVEAQLALRRLEGVDGEVGAKRRKTVQEEEEYEEEMRRLDEENERGWREIWKEKEEAAAVAAEKVGGETKATTLLSSEVIGNLQALSALRQSQATTTTTKAAAGRPMGLGSLAAYGSDSDDDDDERAA
ncbi:Pre-mRNA-splicing factor [Thecaphora frezii]